MIRQRQFVRRTHATGAIALSLSASLGARLASIRKDLGLSQAALARRVPTSHSAISQIEAGQRNATYTMLCYIAAALGVTPAYLVGADLEALDAEEQQLFRRYRSLSAASRQELERYAEYLQHREKGVPNATVID